MWQLKRDLASFRLSLQFIIQRLYTIQHETEVEMIEQSVCKKSIYPRHFTRLLLLSYLVGVKIRAKTPYGSSQRSCNIARAKTAVLPLPVLAQAMQSLPFSISGIHFAWISVGFLTPIALHCLTSQSFTPKHLNDSTWFSSAILAAEIARKLGMRDEHSLPSICQINDKFITYFRIIGLFALPIFLWKFSYYICATKCAMKLK